MRLRIITLSVLSALAFCLDAQVPVMNISEEETGSSELSKKELWYNLRKWVSLTFDSSDVIDMEDPDHGTMIIKWSCGVKQTSEFINSSVSGILQIDVRDGKYRIRSINPRVALQFKKPSSVEMLNDESISIANDDIRLISSIANKFYDGQLEWDINDDYRKIVAAYLEHASDIRQYKSERDRERNRVNKEWISAQRDWSILNDVLKGYETLNKTMTGSLSQALSLVDGF